MADERSEADKRLTASPVNAVTRATFSTDDAAAQQLKQLRIARAAMLPNGAPYDANAAEETVAVMVNNGTYGGYRAIGRYFPNGLTQDVRVTAAELAELKNEPSEIIRVVSAADLSGLQGGSGKSESASSAPELADDEKEALEAFRKAKASGQADAFLAQAQKTGTQTSSVADATPPSSTASSEDTKSLKARK